MGTGILNWVFALPAFFTIDTWGRRNLLLFTFPFLCICLLVWKFSNLLPSLRYPCKTPKTTTIDTRSVLTPKSSSGRASASGSNPTR